LNEIQYLQGFFNFIFYLGDDILKNLLTSMGKNDTIMCGARLTAICSRLQKNDLDIR